MHLRLFLIFFICTSTSVQNALGGHCGDKWEKVLADNEKQTIIPLRTSENKIYYFGINHKVTFLEAEQFCRDIHMRLVTIKSSGELIDLYRHSEKMSDETTFWSSGSKLLDNKNYIWLSTGELVDKVYVKQANTDKHSGNCLTLKRSRSKKKLRLKSRGCERKYNFICERVKYEPLETCDEKDKKWTALFQDPSLAKNINVLRTKTKTYYIGTNLRVAPQQAAQFCQIINMDLVSITSRKENKLLGKYIQNNNLIDNFWSSGTKVLDGTTWVWLAEGVPVTYTNWASREPHGDEKQCILLTPGNDGLEWKSSYCKTEAAFICESGDRQPKKHDKTKWKFGNLEDVDDYVTNMHEYLQDLGLVVGSMAAPLQHFKKPAGNEKSEAVKHLDQKTIDYITLLLEHLYDYISTITNILQNPEERAKYKTEDLKNGVISIQNWLEAIRKLLYPKGTKAPKDRLDCDNVAVSWEECVNSLNRTIQNYAVLTGLIYLPTGEKPNDKSPLGSEARSPGGNKPPETFGQSFGNVLSTIFKPMFGSLLDPRKPEPAKTKPSLLGFPSLPDFPIIPGDDENPNDEDEPSEEQDAYPSERQQLTLPNRPTPPKIKYVKDETDSEEDGELLLNMYKDQAVPKSGRAEDSRLTISPQGPGGNNRTYPSGSNSFVGMLGPLLNGSIQITKPGDESSNIFSNLHSGGGNRGPVMVGGLTPGLITFETMVQHSQISMTEWTQDGRKFMAVRYKTNPEQAAKICRDHGMELISMKDRRTNDIVTRFLGRSGPIDLEFYWTSGTRQPDGKWAWVDKSPVEFTSWAPGQPDNLSGKEDCICMDAGGRWNDASCDRKHNFVCDGEDVEHPAQGTQRSEFVQPRLPIFKPTVEVYQSFGGRMQTDNQTASPLVKSFSSRMQTDNQTASLLVKSFRGRMQTDNQTASPLVKSFSSRMQTDNQTASPLVKSFSGRMQTDNQTASPLVKKPSTE
ncbi:uncharacterized protein LOC108912373 isoform X2 [Anoplophora glabripennis]|uniref:uncharacterized protein LOC108912373 isoform X2 n=1 Tax=Anoplophora glabripennis TaxID=217634 RepID=UPI00087551C2|nr:uncharacterized protein LOC108912373 isoform X2 [Anoplophora glabripennis]